MNPTTPPGRGSFVIHTLELVTMNIYAKFEVPIHVLWQHRSQAQMYT